MPEIRPAQPADHAAVAALWRQYAPGVSCTEANFLADLPICTVAVENGVVVGFCLGHHASGAWLECQVQPAPDADWDCSYLETLVVDERVRGRGVGTTLLEDFTARARAAGATWLLLYPKRGDSRPLATDELLRFHTRAGLGLVEPREDHLRDNPWMMDRPLVTRPPHVFARSSAAVEALARAA